VGAVLRALPKVRYWGKNRSNRTTVKMALMTHSGHRGREFPYAETGRSECGVRYLAFGMPASSDVPW
jgi:hypothetical protein